MGFRWQQALGSDSGVQVLGSSSLSLSLGSSRLKMGVTGLKVKQKCKLFYTLGVYILQSIEIIFRLTEFSGQSKHVPWCKRFFVFLLQPKQKQSNTPTHEFMLFLSIPASSCYFQCTTHKSICATCITLERQYNYFHNFLQITTFNDYL